MKTFDLPETEAETRLEKSRWWGDLLTWALLAVGFGLLVYLLGHLAGSAMDNASAWRSGADLSGGL